MTELKFNHTPYDCRHTFVTKMKKAGANEYILKLIVGHKLQKELILIEIYKNYTKKSKK